MKIRLYKGPLDGKVLDLMGAGEEVIVLGPKKISREKMMDYLMTQGPLDPPRPMIRCIYRKAYRMTVSPGLKNTTIFEGPCVHPDGSTFYVYERTISEYPGP